MSADSSALAQAAFWCLATLAGYALCNAIYRRHRHTWLSPVLLAPVLLIGLTLLLRTPYSSYLSGTGWLLTMLGPATAAMALPIYRERVLIRRCWPLLLVTIVIGSVTAVLGAWLLASLLQIDGAVARSLIPRSITTPFAMELSARIGGIPALTAVLVIITGLFGALVGERLLAWLPAEARLARGCAYGMAAHGVGVARAYELDPRIGAIAGLTMIIAGVGNVLVGVLVWKLL
jgi:predicted murein hydrolase (TIGR00659 family)